MRIIFIGIYLFIACIAVLIIHRIRRRRFAPGSAIDESQSGDFIADLSQMNRKRLAAQPWNMSYETYTAIGTVMAIIFAVLGYLYGGMLYAIAAGFIGLIIPELVVRIQSASQKQKFEERYARSLRQLSAGLKSGMSLHQAIEDVCHSAFVHEQMQKEFQQLSTELKLGVSIPDAFEHFAQRVGTADAEDVAIAVKMQMKVGGREGAAIETIAKNISDRMMLRKEINSMFAGSSVTIAVLDVVPFAIIFFLTLGMNQFMGIYFESTEMFLLYIGLLAVMGVGTIVTHSMVGKMKKECGVK